MHIYDAVTVSEKNLLHVCGTRIYLHKHLQVYYKICMKIHLFICTIYTHAHTWTQVINSRHACTQRQCTYHMYINAYSRMRSQKWCRWLYGLIINNTADKRRDKQLISTELFLGYLVKWRKDLLYTIIIPLTKFILSKNTNLLPSLARV